MRPRKWVLLFDRDEGSASHLAWVLQMRLPVQVITVQDDLEAATALEGIRFYCIVVAAHVQYLRTKLVETAKQAQTCCVLYDPKTGSTMKLLLEQVKAALADKRGPRRETVAPWQGKEERLG